MALAGFLGPPESAEVRAAGSRLLRRCLGRFRWRALALVVVALAGVATTVLLPAVLSVVVDAALAGTGLPAALGALVVVLAVATAVDALDDLIGSYLGIAMTAGLRQAVVTRALALGMAGTRRFPTGDLLTRLAVNADGPAGFLPLLLSAGTTALTALGGVVALALIDWRLAVTFLLGVPVALLLIRAFLATAGEPFLRYQQLQAAIMTRMLDAAAGARTIRASGAAVRESARILEPLPELHAAGRQVWLLQGRATWRLALLAPAVQILVLAVGGFALTGGAITAGQLVAAVSYTSLGLAAVGLADSFVSLLGCQLSAGRVAEVLDARPAVAPPSHPVPVPAGPGRLDLRGVTVLAEGRVLLHQLDLTVPAGASVAVVGRSGTGKSLLVALFGRLHDPDRGVACLDGQPVDRFDLAALRRTVTYAFDRPALLGATVHDTIAYGRPGASREQVAAAAAVAQADRFVRLLPDGYDTPLTAAPMSGGELQRLGLARAVLADARVVVLDDATSSLDMATELKVVNALADVLAGRTSIVVAHRAATAARADLVAWLDRGRIRELAPHHELWNDPEYRAAFAVVADPVPAQPAGLG